MFAQAAVDSWTGDSLHLNTMISPNLIEIGAGVAASGGKLYYVIDCAHPTTSGAPRGAATSVEGGSAVPAAETVIIPVTLSTPNADGDVVHEVKAGQTLWQIAIAYEVRIDEIKSLNNLLDNNIYPGNKLLIKRRITLPTASLAASPTQVTLSISTSMSAATVLTASVTLTPTPIFISSSAFISNSVIMKIVMGIIALAILGGGILTWRGGPRKK